MAKIGVSGVFNTDKPINDHKTVNQFILTNLLFISISLSATQTRENSYFPSFCQFMTD